MLLVAANGDESVGHVRLVRLSSAGLAGRVEDRALHSFERVLHDGTFDRWEFAVDRNGPVLRRTDVEVAPLAKARIPSGSLLLRALGGDNALALLAQLIERISVSRADEPARRLRVGFEGRQEHRGLRR
ncbi:MAG: hypothetical protein WB592_10410 [Acidimicrobiales bacterium]